MQGFNIENSTTKEQLVIRNAIFETPETEVYYGGIIRYAEVVRHPIGAAAKMREWVDKRAYFEDAYYKTEEEGDDEEGPQPYYEAFEQVIWIAWPSLTIG